MSGIQTNSSAPEAHSRSRLIEALASICRERPIDRKVLVSGVIDLAFREGDRWCVVDYKTDRITGDASALVDFYAGQLRLYAKAWNQLAGCPVSELLLFFTDSRTPHRIP